MLLLSRITGRNVLAPEGDTVGRIADLSVRLGHHAGAEVVERLVVRAAHGATHFVHWDAVETFETSAVRLRFGRDTMTSAGPSTPDALHRDEVLLSRDVLDTQVFDINGQRLARVADVLLNRVNGGRLEVVGVEVGFGAVLRRLGLRKTAGRIGDDVVAWSDLHLTSERGHAAQLVSPRSAVHHLDAAALAELVSRLDVESANEILGARGAEVAGDVIRAAHPTVGERVLRAMPTDDAAMIVATLPAEHAAHWRARLAEPTSLMGRRFLRSHVWPRRRHYGSGRGTKGTALQ